MSKPIREYWPEYYDTLLDFLKLAETEDVEIQSLEAAVNQLLNDQFVLTSGYEAIKRREKMLNIQADPTTETLDFRKKRIINRYSTKPPFTIRYIQDRLDFLVGEGKALANVDVQNFILWVETAIEDAALFRELEYTVKATKPANLIYNQKTALLDEIILQEYISKRDINRQSRLGTTWRLGTMPFATLGPEVVIK